MRFPYRFRRPGQPFEMDTDRPGDANLKARIRHGRRQHEAILAWLVEGAQIWYENDRQFLKPDPERIERDRIEWRKRDDSVWQFIDEQLEFDSDAHVMSTDLFRQFTIWQATQNQTKWGDKTFFDRLANHQVIAKHGVSRKRGVRKRRDSGLSVPTGVVSLAMIPEQYTAWFGLRFNLEVTFEY